MANFTLSTGPTKFYVNTDGLTDGSGMFKSISVLTSFSGGLPNLTNGYHMFSGCTLDKDSVHRIAESIPSKPDDATSGYSLTLGIDYSLHEDADVAADLATITTTKKWSLTTQWN